MSKGLRPLGRATIAGLGLGLLALCASPAAADTAESTQPPPAADAQRQRQEQQLQELLNMRGDFDRRIRALEVELHGSSAATPPAASDDIIRIPAQPAEALTATKWGGYEAGK